MAEINAWCKICGTGYHVCKACGNMKSFTPWRMVADNIGHYSIFLTLHQYALDGDKEKARKELESMDLSEKDTFVPSVQKQINEIMDAENVVENNTVKSLVTVENKSESENVESDNDKIITDVVVETQEEPVKKMKYVPKNKRKNNYANFGDTEDVE